MNDLYLTINDYEFMPYMAIYDVLKDKNIIISNDVLQNILLNEQVYNKFISLLKSKKTNDIQIILANGEKKWVVNKVILLKLLVEYQKNNQNLLLKRDLDEFIESFSYLKIRNSKEIYSNKIDSYQLAIPVSEFYDFLFLEDSEYSKFFTSKEANYKNIPREIFIYALINYFMKNHLFEQYIFPDFVVQRIQEIKKMQLIDYESINQITKIKDQYFDLIRINQEMDKILFSSNEDDLFTNIVNTYLKLCNLFSYDESYHVDNTSVSSIQHNEITNLENITDSNNKIVCFEFTSIFAYYLNKLGINYEIIGENEEYGFLHNYLVFRYGKYLIKVDPIPTVLKSDLTAVKTNRPLIGFELLNQNQDSQKEFQKLVGEIYQAKEIDFSSLYLPQTKFSYNEINFSPKIKELLQKLDLVFAKLNEKELEKTDKIAYLLDLIKLEFTKHELEFNLSPCLIVSNSNPKKIFSVFTINEFSYMNLDNYYLVYDLEKLYFISKEELEDKFDNYEFEYLNERTIPGLRSKKYPH